MTKQASPLSAAFKGTAQENDRADLIDTIMPATVNLAVIKGDQGGTGSGFVYDSARGYIITNNHVVNGAAEIKILTSDERILSGTVVGTDKFTDIAVVKYETKKPLTQAKLGDSDKMRVGNDVIAIGAPMGLAGTVTTGIISAKDRDIGAGPYDQLLQHDASINPGNSGGALFNSAGEVIGVNAMIISRSGSSAGIGLAIPVNQAKWVADQIIANGSVRWGYLGASVSSIPEDHAPRYKLDEARGVAVHGVTPGSPAERGGLMAGDVVLAINGMDAKTPRFLTREIAKVTAGGNATLDVWRDGAARLINVTVGERPVELARGPIIVEQGQPAPEGFGRDREGPQLRRMPPRPPSNSPFP
jgi:serine protease Do